MSFFRGSAVPFDHFAKRMTSDTTETIRSGWLYGIIWPLFSARTSIAPLIDAVNRSWDSRQAFCSSGLGSQAVPEVITRTGMPSGMTAWRMTIIFSAKLLPGAPTIRTEARCHLLSVSGREVSNGSFPIMG